MNNPPILRFAVLFLGFAPNVLWAASKSQEAYLVHPSSQTVKRRESVLSLGQSNDPHAGEKLVESLSDRDPMTRTLAAQGLGSLKNAAAVPRLIKLLATDPYPEVRQAAAVSLRQIENPQAVDALNKALSDSAPNVRLSALAGLARFKDAKSRPFIEAACKDPVVEVRRTAVFALARLDDLAAVPTIQRLLEDPDAAVKAGAAQALGDLHSIDSKSLLLPLLNVPEKGVQASAARSLLMLGDRSGYETAKALVSDSDVAVRMIAIDALGWSKDPGAEADLQSLLIQAPANLRPAVQEALTRTQQLRKQ